MGNLFIASIVFDGHKAFYAVCLTLAESNLSVYRSSNNDDDNDEIPYCDQAEPGYETCFDSQDYDDVTGLAPCKDGSQVYDYRDCPDRED